MARKLSKAQERALDQLTDKWQTRRDIGATNKTINILIKMGLVEERRRSPYVTSYHDLQYRKLQKTKFSDKERSRILKEIKQKKASLETLKDEIVSHLDHAQPLANDTIEALREYGIKYRENNYDQRCN